VLTHGWVTNLCDCLFFALLIVNCQSRRNYRAEFVSPIRHTESSYEFNVESHANKIFFVSLKSLLRFLNEPGAPQPYDPDCNRDESKYLLNLQPEFETPTFANFT